MLNGSLAMSFESGKFIGSGGYGLESNDDGTRLSYWFNGTPKNFVFKLIMPLMMPMFRRQVRKDYANLKRVIESNE